MVLPCKCAYFYAMPFKPVKQFNAILTQEYFEPTFSYALRVVLALNVPLIVLPLLFGFSEAVVWASFGAYLLALLDYEGLHYKKILIQICEALLIFCAGVAGAVLGSSLWLSVIAMFFVGMIAAVIRNRSDYGASIGVAFGFFFLLGMASPVPFEQALTLGRYTLLGCAWSVFITLLSFPLRPSSPVKRSVANIWKANTDLLDAITQHQNTHQENFSEDIAKKEMAVRSVINKSIDWFKRQNKNSSKTQHYNQLMELRRVSALFSATLSSMHAELEIISGSNFHKTNETVFYKTLSALSQASARMAIVIFTSRPQDLTLAKVRVQRSAAAVNIFKETCRTLNDEENIRVSLQHFIDTLEKALEYLEESITLTETKLNLKKSDYFENYKLTFSNFAAGLNTRTLFDFIRSLININSEQFIYALRVALGLSVGVFVFLFFHIDHGQWIAITMIIVIQPYYGATRKKGLERVIGTLAGVVLGGLIMLLPLKHEAFVVLLIFVSFFVAYFLRNNYKVGVFFVTLMMVVLLQLLQEGSLRLIAWRALSTLLGALLAVVAGHAFFPTWEKKRFPGLLFDALTETKNYLQQVILFYNNDLPPDETWYKQRRLAEMANNRVFASAQRMSEEPEYAQQHVDIGFAIVGANIRMVRDINSIGLLADENRALQKIEALENYLKQINALFADIIEPVANGTVPFRTPDFTQVKESLNAPVFSSSEQLQFIKMELEKIVFELETLCKLNEKRN